MMKSIELANSNSCLSRSAPNEPVFVLVARDPHAPQAIRHWIAMSMDRQPPEKIEEAYKLANQMEEWKRKNAPETIPAAAPALGIGAENRNSSRY